MSASSDPLPALAPEPREGGAAPALWRWTRGAAAALLILAAWGGIKVGWEQRIAREENALRYHGLDAALTRHLGDQLGQGALLGLLGGLRAVVANFVWISMNTAFQEEQWYKVKSDVELVTALQPRSVLFWDMGAWELAWNAATAKLHNLDEPSQARRLLDARFWVEQGRQVLLRGVENIPDKYELWYKLGFLEEQRRGDYLAAARYYQEAMKRPGAPGYLERFVGYDLEKGGDLAGAYQWFKQLWLSTGDHTDRVRAWDKVALKIRELEDKLAIPPEKRVFPATKAPQTPAR